MSKAEQTCEHCNWYVAASSQKHGFCKSRPPVFTRIDEKGHPRFYNPVVAPHNFCSEWDEVEE